MNIEQDGPIFDNFSCELSYWKQYLKVYKGLKSVFLKLFWSGDHFFKLVLCHRHLTLVHFKSKFIISVAYFNTVYLYAIWHVLLLVYNIQYMTISMCRLGVGKIIKNVINTWKVQYFGPLFEFGWSMAGLQTRCQMCRENTLFAVR